MNSDLNRLRQFGQELMPPAGQPPADLRRRVLAPRPMPRRMSRPVSRAVPRRWGTASRLSALVAAAAAAVVALSLLPAAPLGSLAQGTDRARPAKTVQQILQLAAAHAALGPELAARDHQFIFLERITEFQDIRLRNRRIETEPLALVQEWRSVDGTRDGVTRERPLETPGARWKNLTFPGCPANRPKGCEPEPGIDRRLPTDGDAMHAYLYRPLADDPQAQYTAQFTVDERAFVRALGVLFQAQASTRVQAALFTALVRVPGVRLSPRGTDVAGRTGVALVHDGPHGSRAELLFDPVTYGYLGTNQTLAPVDYSGPGLEFIVRVAARTAYQRVAVVDYVGELP